MSKRHRSGSGGENVPVSDTLPADYPTPGKLDGMGPILRRVVGINDKTMERQKEADQRALDNAIETGQEIAVDLDTAGQFCREFFALDNLVPIANSGRISLEQALGINGEGSLLAQALDDPHVIRAQVDGSIGPFWKRNGVATGPKGHGVFSRDKIVALGEIYSWSNEEIITVLVYTFGINTDRIGATSRGIILGEKIKPADALQKDRLLARANMAAISAREDEATFRRPKEYL